MSDEDKDSKTEQASEQKLRRAREKGDSYSSREAGHTMSYLALLVVVALIIPAFAPRTMFDLSLVYDRAGQMTIDTPEELQAVLGRVAWSAAGFALPALGVMVALAMLSALLAGPFIVSLKRIEPKFSKLNPLGGLKKIFSTSNLIEFAKSLVKLLMIGFIVFSVMRSTVDHILPGAIILPETLMGVLDAAVFRALALIVALMIPVMAFDIFWKRSEWLKKQRMSKKDVKDEHKDSEGDPQIKMRRQEISRARARQQIAKAVPEATLIVTNPTHYAVALRYERGVDLAPVCLAKGQDLLAFKIREIALAHEIPVLESPPLARALHKVVEVDQTVPEEHWAAVAELVGYVLDLRRRVRRKLPEGTHHVDP